MLPFLDKVKRQSGVIITNRQPDGDTPKEKSMDDTSMHAMEACARDLIRGVHTRDEKLVVEAMKSLFEIADSRPQIEGNSYEAQNQKAGSDGGSY